MDTNDLVHNAGLWEAGGQEFKARFDYITN